MIVDVRDDLIGEKKWLLGTCHCDIVQAANSQKGQTPPAGTGAAQTFFKTGNEMLGKGVAGGLTFFLHYSNRG